MSPNVAKFIELQDRVNREIEDFGEATMESCNELERIGGQLTRDEISEMLTHYEDRTDPLEQRAIDEHIENEKNTIQ